MANYPMRDVKTQDTEHNKGSNTGSITYIKREPDFDKFTKDWANYNYKKLHNENESLKGIIGGIVFIIILAIVYLSGR
ncbi:hypothetical protein [Desulforhopalus sp. IMCC35007]|uniref:hypothetical protein n=1 Tax=Desulforhopalus sp. IMCC35007 TaxID=2569543 RepID=UPI0010AEDFB1|nr:hypothetical protein [Desulforhopalus sp. IMCC35007]TKB07456.1 hypothetical protein FCL48_17090 [Desulforhopalus sp. IMCC35007]